MAKFCGKCGAKLDETTGLCPNCDADKIKEQGKNASGELEDMSRIQNQEDTHSILNDKEQKKEDKKTDKKAKKAQKKAAKKEKRAQWSTGKKIRHFLLKLVLSLLLLVIVVGGVIGALVYFGLVNISSLFGLDQNNMLEIINDQNIFVEEKEVVMTNATEGKATLVVKFPDYGELFEKAYASGNPDLYLLKALFLKDYEIQEFEVSANVTVDDGKRIIHSDEAVHQLLEEVLVDAINTQSEVKE